MTSIAALAALAVVAPAARAQDAAVPAEILVVLASEAEGEIDPMLAEMPALRRAPFNAFHTMQVLTRSEGLTLSPSAPLSFTLPNGRTLRVELDRTADDGRHRVRVSINTPGRADYLPLLSVLSTPGEPFFIAGQSHTLGPISGTLVIGVRVGQRGAASGAAAAPPRRKV